MRVDYRQGFRSATCLVGMVAIATTSCTKPVTESRPETKTESRPETKTESCQYKPLSQKAVPGISGQYQYLQFTYTSLESETASPKSFTVHALKLEPATFTARLLDHPSQDANVYQTIPEVGRAQNAIAVINGGYYDTDFNPLGLSILQGQTETAMSESNLLSGILNIDPTGQIFLTPRSEFQTQNTVDAIQAGPFLIDPGSKIGIYSDNGKLRKRTVVGLSTTQQTLILTTSPVSLYPLAQCLKMHPEAFGVNSIDRALNLDGAVSTGLYIDFGDSVIKKAEELPVRNVLIIKALESSK